MNVMENYFCPYQYSLMLDTATAQRGLFLVTRESAERQEWRKIWLFSLRIKSKGQAGPGAQPQKVFQEYALFSSL